MSINNTLKHNWDNCENGGQVLWMAHDHGVNEMKIIEARVSCAIGIRHLIEDKRSLKAIDVALEFCAGLCTKEELIKATDIAYEAYQDAFKTYDASVHKDKSKRGYQIMARYYATYAIYDAVRPFSYKNTSSSRKRDIRVIRNIQAARGYEFRSENPHRGTTNDNKYFEARDFALKETALICKAVLSDEMLK